ncbi:glycosyltransferase [Paracoccus sp. (in: a-proteobacteria)]|uniref:glycosyltransferase n=1 Tax=Paracoccus sp. TaxID=267 RepID=UPI00272B6087|nr:glycosyltransferase [Paracoccus sp. (in: a-proteobacteria)]
MRIQVLGLCRFSMLASGDFQTTGTDLAANRRILYDAHRMSRRMAWFENLCLPPLIWQQDQDFTLVVATGIDLPEPWIGRLRTIAEAVPQIRLEQLPPDRQAAMCREALSRHTDLSADVVAQFRMDDDDAVALDYVRRVRADFRLVERLLNPHHPVVVNYTNGLVAEWRHGGLRLHREMAPNWGLAQSFYFTGGKVRSAMNYRHDKVWAKVATLSIPDRPMWIRGHHDVNDSGGHLIGRNRVEAEDAEIDDILGRRFGLDRAALAAALGEGSKAAAAQGQGKNG